MRGPSLMNKRKHVEITIDDEMVEALEGEPLVAVFLRLHDIHTRITIGSATPRAPFCMMGVCYECVVNITGTGYARSCQERVREGMIITRQSGLRSIK